MHSLTGPQNNNSLVNKIIYTRSQIFNACARFDIEFNLDSWNQEVVCHSFESILFLLEVESLVADYIGLPSIRTACVYIAPDRYGFVLIPPNNLRRHTKVCLLFF